jgi:cobalt-zinc-cadmium efflux system protein
MKGAYFEVLSDMLTSIGVIVAAIIMLTTGWYYADPIVSAGIGLFILPRTWILLKESVGVLLEGTPADVNVFQLRSSILTIPGVKAAHDLHVWSLTSGYNAMSCHIVINEGLNYNDTLRLINDTITANFKIAHTTIQLEVGDYKESGTHL